jgi:hypothetical protein
MDSSDNPHDVYFMPPLHKWDIAALEKALSGPFGSGQLRKLDCAGILGKSKEETETISAVSNENLSEDDTISEGNPQSATKTCLKKIPYPKEIHEVESL